MKARINASFSNRSDSYSQTHPINPSPGSISSSHPRTKKAVNQIYQTLKEDTQVTVNAAQNRDDAVKKDSKAKAADLMSKLHPEASVSSHDDWYFLRDPSGETVYYQGTTGVISRLLPDGYVTTEGEPLAPDFPASDLSFDSLDRICRANYLISSCRVVAESQKLFRRRSTLSGAPSFVSGRRQSDGETGNWARSVGRRDSNASSLHQSVESRESEPREAAEFAPPEMKRSSSMRGGATTHDERPLLARLASTMHVGTLDRRQNQSFYKAGLGQLFTVASSSGYLAELKEMLFEEGEEVPLTLRPVIDDYASGLVEKKTNKSP